MKQAHLVSWVNKYIADGNSVEILNSDKREEVSIGHNRIIPVLLQGAIDEFVLVVLASKCESNSVILRPFITKFMKEYNDGLYQHLIGDNKFVCSLQWIRNMLKRLNQSYRNITNDAGKLPDTWHLASSYAIVKRLLIIYVGCAVVIVVSNN